MYEKCPCEEDENQEIAIFDENLLRLQQTQTPFHPQILNKDTFVLDDVTYVIDHGHPSKPQIYPTPQHTKRMQLHYQSLAIIINRLTKDKVCSSALLNTYFFDNDGVLYQSVREELHICKAMVVPKTSLQLVITTTMISLAIMGL